MLSDKKFEQYKHIASNIRAIAKEIGKTIPASISDKALIEVWDCGDWPDDNVMIECIVGEIEDDRTIRILKFYESN